MRTIGNDQLELKEATRQDAARAEFRAALQQHKNQSVDEQHEHGVLSQQQAGSHRGKSQEHDEGEAEINGYSCISKDRRTDTGHGIQSTELRPQASPR